MPELGKPQNTIDIIKKYDFRFRKKFGQNFLIDTNVLGKIADSACIDPGDCVLEIGPGIGTLTQYLAERARQVVAVEIDPELIPILSETLAGFPNAEVIHADIMKTDIRELAEKYNGGKPLNVVANLPYYITTPIIMSLLEDGAPVKSITVMIQKEVAERMQAGPGVLLRYGDRGECAAELLYPTAECGFLRDPAEPLCGAAGQGKGSGEDVQNHPGRLQPAAEDAG